MSKNRPSLLTLLVLGVIGPNAAWSAPEAPTTVPAARAAVSADAPTKNQALTDLRTQIIDLRNRQQAAPDDPELNYQLGALYLDAGDPKAAEEQLRRAIDKGTTAADAWVLLGQAWLLQEKYVEIQAQIPFDQLPDTAAKAGVAVLQGQAWLAKERPADARKSFKEALVLEPDFSPAYVGLARVSLAEGNLPAATASLKSAEQGRRSDPAEVATLRGDLAATEKDYAGAETAYQQAANTKPFQVSRLRPLAQVQIPLKKLDEAEGNLSRVLAQRKGDPQALFLSSYSAYMRGDYERAFNTVSPLLDGRIGDPAAIFIGGASSYYLGNDQQARELLTRYLGLQPGDAFAARLLGATLVRQGEPVEALRVLTPLVQLERPAYEDLTLAGMAALLSDRPKDALAFLQRAQEQKPQDKGLSRLLAFAKAGSGAGAAELEQLVAEGGDGFEDLELGLLQRFVRDEDYAQLLTGATRFQARHPERAEGWVYEGIAQSRTGQPVEAQRAFEKARQLSPRNLDALIGLADAQMAQGHPDTAAAAIRDALKDCAGQSGPAV